MPANLDNQLVVALSSRALFDFEEENAVFDAQGPAAYEKLQLSRLNQPAAQGVAFDLARKLLAFNAEGEPKVEVVILSQNDPVTDCVYSNPLSIIACRSAAGCFCAAAQPTDTWSR